MDFTPIQEPPKFQICGRCGPETPYGLETAMTFVAGPPGQPGRMCCPNCVNYYATKRRNAQLSKPEDALQQNGESSFVLSEHRPAGPAFMRLSQCLPK